MDALESTPPTETKKGRKRSGGSSSNAGALKKKLKAATFSSIVECSSDRKVTKLDEIIRSVYGPLDSVPSSQISFAECRAMMRKLLHFAFHGEVKLLRTDTEVTDKFSLVASYVSSRIIDVHIDALTKLHSEVGVEALKDFSYYGYMVVGI